jgi:AGZA family xanthine/uracil permease-like MFS transporter
MLVLIREWLVNSIPRNLKLGMAAGIGLFLGFIALQDAGIIVDNPDTLVALGNIMSFEPLAFILGFVVIAGLSATSANRLVRRSMESSPSRRRASRLCCCWPPSRSR